MRISDEVLIASLLSHRTQQEAAEELGLHTNTITNKLKNPEFLEKLEEAQRAILKETTSNLISTNNQACATLADLLNSNNDSCRLGAAKLILSLSKDYFLFSSLADKVNQIEKSLDDRL